MDILAAFLHGFLSSGVPPGRILKYIASGAIGNSAFEAGWESTMLGLAIHFSIALFWTCLFYYIYHLIDPKRFKPLVTGFIYGCLVWLIMNMVVLPNTAVPQSAVSTANAVIGALILILCFGIPLAFLAPWVLQRGKPSIH